MELSFPDKGASEKEPVAAPDIDQEWLEFFANNSGACGAGRPAIAAAAPAREDPCMAELDPEYFLSISTKTIILFLNQTIDINLMFWQIPVIQYWNAEPGVVKKQMKVVSKTPAELELYHGRLADVEFYTENILKHIDNPAARSIRFKDERKITIGISRKNIMNSNSKVKNAFYNCMAVIVRISPAPPCASASDFREVHVKIFNTGKIEIPGVVSDDLSRTIEQAILDILSPIVGADAPPLGFLETTRKSSVLINSNFNCGHFVNRGALYAILRSDKYQIEAAYDPCSYPGVKCKFYFNHDIGFDEARQTGQIAKEDRAMKVKDICASPKYTDVSFMIFRTGSGLIVGNCTDAILALIFRFVKRMLAEERVHIWVAAETKPRAPATAKVRRRTVHMTAGYFSEIYDPPQLA